MIGVWALGVYLVVILAWTTLLRRNVGEAMVVGFVVAAVFNGSQFLSAGWDALYAALVDEIVYATVVFVFMGYLLEKAGVTHRMIDLLDALIGHRRGGPAYVSTVASAGLGSIVHNQAAIAATVGSVTIPWMERTRVDRTTAATIVAVAAPLSSTATMAAVGVVGVAALAAAGVPATTAAVAVLIFSSCEAAVPPGGAPLYVACGIAGVDPLHTFRRMLAYYALPLLGIGVLVASGILPV